MEEYILVGGKTASNMEKAFILIQKEFDAKACGITANGNIGSKKTDFFLKI